MKNDNKAPASNHREKGPGLLRRVEELELVCGEFAGRLEELERRLGSSKKPTSGVAEEELELPF